MPDLQRSKMRHRRKMMFALPLASARLSKLYIPFLNRVLDGELCANFFDFVFSFFTGFQSRFYHIH